MLTTVTTKIDSIKSKIADWAKSLLGNMLSAFSSAVGQLSSIGSLVWEQIKGSLPSIGSIKDYVTGAVTGSGGGKGGDSKPNGKHYSGAYNIPYNGYQATLHSGESVLTASQSATLRGAGILSSRNGNLPVVNAGAGASSVSASGPINRSVNVTVTNMTVRQESDISRIASELAAIIETSDARNR